LAKKVCNYAALEVQKDTSLVAYPNGTSTGLTRWQHIKDSCQVSPALYTQG
jgi:hypothetical protein